MTLGIQQEDSGSDNSLRLQLIGSLDGDTATELDQYIDQHAAPSINHIIYNMAQLDYISSAGLRSIFMSLKKMQAKGGKVAVVNRQPQIVKVFDIVKAIPDLQIFASWDEMDSYLNAMQTK